MSEDNKPTTRITKKNERIYSQLAAIDAIREGTNLNIRCFLARTITDDFMGWNPENRDDFEFTVKGALRIDMDRFAGEKECEYQFRGMPFGSVMGRNEYSFWRRLFGTAAEEKKGKHKPKFEDKPRSWKSRCLLSAFDNAQEVQIFVNRCPLYKWSGGRECPLLSTTPLPSQGGYFLLLQVHDVELAKGKNFTDLLHDFLNGNSSILQFIAEHSCSLLGDEK